MADYYRTDTSITMISSFLQDTKRNTIFLFLFFLLIFLSTWRLAYSPATWFDEGINMGIAKSLAEYGVYSLETSPGAFVAERQFLITTNYPLLFPVALSLKLFGINLTAARIPSVAYLITFGLLSYVVANKFFKDKNAALFTLALLVTFAPLYGNGKGVLGEVTGLAYLLAGLLALPRIFHIKRLLLSGFLFGLSIAAKPFFLLLIPAVFLGEWYGAKRYRTPFWKRICLIATGAIPPLFGWLWSIIPAFSFAGIVSALHYYSNSYAAGDFRTLIISNLARFVTESTPLHFLVLFLFSLLFWIRRWRKKILESHDVILAAFIILNFLWYLKTPGWYRYFFPVHLLLFLSFPKALCDFFHTYKKIAYTTIIGLILFQSAHLITRRSDPLYYSEEVVQFSDIIRREVPIQSDLFVINAPSLSFLLEHQNVYQFLQVNPSRFFGRPNLFSSDQNRFSYVVTGGSLDGIAMRDVTEQLGESYDVVEQEGHYTLYKKRG